MGFNRKYRFRVSDLCRHTDASFRVASPPFVTNVVSDRKPVLITPETKPLKSSTEISVGAWRLTCFQKKNKYLSETRIPLMEFYQRWRRMALQNGKCDDGYQQLLVPSHFVDNCRFMTCLIQGWNDTGSCLLAHSVSATRTDRKWLAASTTISFPSLAYISSKRKLRWGSFYFPSD